MTFIFNAFIDMLRYLTTGWSNDIDINIWPLKSRNKTLCDDYMDRRP